MTRDEIKAELLRACEEFRRRGFQLVDDFGEACWGSDANGNGGCALTAAAVVSGAQMTGPDSVVRFARDRFGWSRDEAYSFMWAFDGTTEEEMKATPFDPGAFSLGREIRELTKPIER